MLTQLAKRAVAGLLSGFKSIPTGSMRAKALITGATDRSGVGR